MDYKQLYSGEHLKRINPNWTFNKWSYRHTFTAKMKHIVSLLKKIPKHHKILDAGCGQGLLVEKFQRLGYDIIGVDAFYESEHVRKDDILKTNFPENSFDTILCLDVIEHFPHQEQETLIKELKRICKPNGRIIWSIPNLAHLSSRISFLLLGKPLRTAKEEYHPGDRAIKEYNFLISKHLTLETKKGLSPTIPILFQATQLIPHYTGWLYQGLKPFSIFPDWCFNVIVVSKNK